jgi:hypothetical protein
MYQPVPVVTPVGERSRLGMRFREISILSRFYSITLVHDTIFVRTDDVQIPKRVMSLDDTTSRMIDDRMTAVQSIASGAFGMALRKTAVSA